MKHRYAYIVKNLLSITQSSGGQSFRKEVLSCYEYSFTVSS